MNTQNFLRMVDKVFDDLLSRLGCQEGPDVALISHWQDGTFPGYRIQVTRRADGASLTKFVCLDGTIRV